MAEGGIVGYASGGSAKMMRDADEEEALAAEEKMYGSGIDNDFIQSIMPAAEGRTPHPSAAISVQSKSDLPIKGAKGTHKYEAEVIKEAKRIGLPPEIAVHSLYKETGGLKDPEIARSRAGALGVMQLMPATAKELGVDPRNPMENIQGGVGYLKNLYDKYQDPQLTLMAYNAGPTRVDRALRSKRGIESLPAETLGYRMAKGGIAHYEDGGVTDVGVPLITSPDMGDLATITPGTPEALFSQGKITFAELKKLKEKEAPVSAAKTTQAAAPVGKRIFPVEPVPMTSPTDAELGRTAQVDKTPEPSKSFMDQIAEEMIQDIRSRKEESKKTREQNNLLALMQAGLGVAASKNIHPLGAIGEGGMQGLGALAQYRKQESEETKDIGAQQLGLYRFGAAAEQNRVLNEIKNAQLANRQGEFSEKQIAAAKDDYREYVRDFETKIKNKYPIVAMTGKETPEYIAEINKFYNSPEIKALRAKAFPAISSLSQGDTSVQSGGWSIKPKG
jgi:hypothetical protein